MSVKVMAMVWDESKAVGNARLVLLAIADSCDHDGTNAWPAVATIARKTLLSERTVQRKIRELTEMGELRVVPGPTHIRWDRRPNGYEVVLYGLSTCHPATEARRQVEQNGVSEDAPRGDTPVTQPIPTRPDPSIVAGFFAEARQILRNGNPDGN